MEIEKDRKCPHCGSTLQPMEGPPETGWGIILVCDNNQCPYFLGSNDTVHEFNPESAIGFRYAENPDNGYQNFCLAAYCGESFIDACKEGSDKK